MSTNWPAKTPATSVSGKNDSSASPAARATSDRSAVLVDA
jgi:hypothetical protein